MSIRGQGGILLSFLSSEEDFFCGTNFAANIYLATNLTNTVADTIQYYHGDGEPTEEDPRLTETAAASLVFTGRLDEVGIEIDIGGFGGLTTNVDSFVAEMHYNISTNYQPVYSNTFVETSATSGLFRSASAITVGRGDLKVAVRSLDGTLPGTYVPAVERIKGPADLLGNGDCTLEFMGETYDLEAEDGWFYPQGGSPRYWVVTDGCIDPGTTVKTYLISCTPNGTIEKIEQPDLFQFANLFYSGTLQFGSKIMQLNINLKGYEAWRAAARENEEVPRTEEEQPGFLITAEVDDVGGADPLEAKIVAAKLADTDTGGLTRWLRFSDPTKVALTRDGIPVEIPAPPEELQIDLPATADATYEISMLDPEAWAADTSVTVEYVIKDREGREFPGADKVRLLRPVIIAIGDSLTFGYMANSNRTALTQNWPQPSKDNYWISYPPTASWAAIEHAPRVALGLPVPAVATDIDNQGWRGHLNADLSPAGFIWEGENTYGHGPKHCGYSGAQTGHINARLTPGHDQWRNMPTEAIKKEPCYAIVIYLIGVNDANMGKDGIYGRWLDGYQKIKSLREGRGKTLFVAATVPPQERRYFHDEADYPKISLVSNLNAQIRGDAKRKSESVREIIVELETISHSEYDDGLHFLSPGYSRIATNICGGVLEGLGLTK